MREARQTIEYKIDSHKGKSDMPEAVQAFSESSPVPTVTARLPAAFHALTGGQKKITAEGNNIREVLVSLDRVVPGALDRIIDQAGPVKGYVNIYRNDSNIRDLEGLETKVENNDVIWIIPAVAGGSEKLDRGHFPACLFYADQW